MDLDTAARHPSTKTTIREKAMLVAPNEVRTHHAVSLSPPTAENPLGYHRLLGGTVEPGETHLQAIIREIDEEIGATIRELNFLGTVENVFRHNGEPGHERVSIFTGRLVPQPPAAGAMLTESDGSIAPIVWRPFADSDEALPLYPAAAREWLHS
jgi:ADP-ribose pyrophosphatase YjhB (NUDIX family)